MIYAVKYNLSIGRKGTSNKMKNFIKNFFRDMADQTFTFLGLFLGWLVLTGSAKVITGKAIIIAMMLWALTHRLRNPKDKD